MTQHIYILLSDCDGTLHSVPSPTGIALGDEEEAKRYVRLKSSYGDQYQTLVLVNTLEEAALYDPYLAQSLGLGRCCERCYASGRELVGCDPETKEPFYEECSVCSGDKVIWNESKRSR